MSFSHLRRFIFPVGTSVAFVLSTIAGVPDSALAQLTPDMAANIRIIVMSTGNISNVRISGEVVRPVGFLSYNAYRNNRKVFVITIDELGKPRGSILLAFSGELENRPSKDKYNLLIDRTYLMEGSKQRFQSDVIGNCNVDGDIEIRILKVKCLAVGRQDGRAYSFDFDYDGGKQDVLKFP
jgi:hypothetical protein